MGAFSEAAPWDLTGKALPVAGGRRRPQVGNGAPGPPAAAPPVPATRPAGAWPPASGWAGPYCAGGWSRSAAPTGWAGARSPGPGCPDRLRKAFERLGPTYIKLGQILSAGEGVFPPELVGEFRLLRDQVPAESFEVVREVVESDLGRPLGEVFEHFETTPIAAASIAQVHAAAAAHRVRTSSSRCSGPRWPASSARDIAAMNWLAPYLIGRIPVATLANPPALVELFAETIVEELDFRLEAENMLDIARVLAETNQRAVVVPRPHPELVTRRVLVMERLSGFCWDDVAGMRRAGIDTSAVVRALLIVFLEGATLFGVFHGDLHGGNLFVQPDGRVALLDYGITGPP